MRAFLKFYLQGFLLIRTIFKFYIVGYNFTIQLVITKILDLYVFENIKIVCIQFIHLKS